MAPEANAEHPATGIGEEGGLGRRTLARPVSVNWHVWPRCNYRCSFCFATFRDVARALPEEQALHVPALLREAGAEKITFAGGEPTLCPHLPDLLAAAKHEDLVTMLVTNGTRLSDAYLDAIAPWTDYIALSIDSASDATEAKLGRGTGNHVSRARRVAPRIKARRISLKVNTTVVAANWDEDMHPLLDELHPMRWKVFQGLPILGENDGLGPDCWASPSQFHDFVQRHLDLSPVVETNDAMTNSYIMLDPVGRFFQNAEGRYRHSDPIFAVGVEEALAQVGWDPAKLEARGGVYDWK